MLKSDGICTTLLYFESFIPCSSESISQKKKKNTNRTAAGKLCRSGQNENGN
jgi:hypothetical protein